MANLGENTEKIKMSTCSRVRNLRVKRERGSIKKWSAHLLYMKKVLGSSPSGATVCTLGTPGMATRGGSGGWEFKKKSKKSDLERKKLCCFQMVTLPGE